MLYAFFWVIPRHLYTNLRKGDSHQTQQFDFYHPLPTPTQPISYGLHVSPYPSQLVSVL